MVHTTNANDLVALYRHALRARLLDDRLTVLSRAGRIGYHPDAQFAELVIVAAAAALAPTDWLFPTARDHAAALVRGVSFGEYVDHVVGNVDDKTAGHGTPGTYSSRALRIAPPSTQVSQHLTHATGLAWAAMLRAKPEQLLSSVSPRVLSSVSPRGEQEAVLAFFSETAADAGDFHSAVNFAGVINAPIVFLCKTDGSEAPAPDVEVKDKAIAYGIHAEECAGHALEVFEHVSAALDRARRGEGPTLLEVRIATSPNPLEQLYRQLLQEGSIDELEDFAWRRDQMVEIDAALTAAFQKEAPSVGSIFDHVFERASSVHASDREAVTHLEGSR